jgi:hypothetical protein
MIDKTLKAIIGAVLLSLLALVIVLKITWGVS